MRFLVDPAKVSRYVPGAHAEAVRRRFGLDRVVKLASNEYPLPPVAGVREAIVAALDDLNRYPDTHAGDLRRALANHYGLPVERVAVGNGSLELLLIVGAALLAPGVEAVFPQPSFALYRRMCDIHGATARQVGLRDHRVDVDAIAAAVSSRTSLVIVCNPNNPTGTYVGADDVRRLASRLPGDVLLVIDEAYNEFVTEDDAQTAIDLVREHDNICVMRTFSKIYGLCGLRIGYALCSESLREVVDTLRQPFNTSLPAQVAATEALRHQDEVAARRRANAELRERLVAGLAELGVSCVPSQANFVLADLTNLAVPVGEACDRLAATGAIVRDGAAFGLAGRARISVGTAEEIGFLLDKVAALTAGERRPDGRSD